MDVEHTSIPAHPALLEDQRAGAFQLERDGHQRNDGDADDAPHDAAYDIHGPFQHLIPQLEFHRAHRHNIAARTAAQFPADTHRTGLIAAGFFNPVQHRQAEMDRQPHALHLLEIGQHVLLTLLRHVQIHFIQRCLPQPVHEIIEVCLDLHPIDLSVKLLRGSFQNGKTGHTLGPVLFQLFQNRACVLLRGHHSHKALNPLGIAGAYQHLFEDSMSARHHKDIDDGHKHQKIAGVQHGSLGQRQTGRINESQQKIEPHRNFNFTNRSAVHDIFTLIKCKKGQDIGQQQ